MAGIPQNFQAISNVIANYDFVDIASGTGYINFYAGKTVDLNLLSNFTYYSDTIYTTATQNTDIYVLLIDNDFDIKLNRPLDLFGKAIVTIPLGVDVDATTASAYVTVTLNKYDGSTETQIATNNSRTYTTSTINYEYTMLAVDLDIATVTHIKKGEYLRLTLQVYGIAGSPGMPSTVSVKLAHDPKSRTTGFDTTGAVPSILTAQLPVRLNL